MLRKTTYRINIRYLHILELLNVTRSTRRVSVLRDYIRFIVHVSTPANTPSLLLALTAPWQCSTRCISTNSINLRLLNLNPQRFVLRTLVELLDASSGILIAPNHVENCCLKCHCSGSANFWPNLTGYRGPRTSSKMHRCPGLGRSCSFGHSSCLFSLCRVHGLPFVGFPRD